MNRLVFNVFYMNRSSLMSWGFVILLCYHHHGVHDTVEKLVVSRLMLLVYGMIFFLFDLLIRSGCSYVTQSPQKSHLSKYAKSYKL